jgi:hypothetical protein
VFGGGGGEGEGRKWNGDKGKMAMTTCRLLPLQFFACQVPERTCKKKNQFTKRLKTASTPQTNIFFLSAQCISTVGIQNPPCKVNVTIPNPI